MCKLRSIFEVDFLNNVYTSFEAQKYPILKVYLGTSFKTKSRSINEVLLSMNKVPFIFFCFYTSFILLFRKFT